MGKRKQGEGSIRQRENGRWECSIMDGFHSDGRRRYKVFYGDSEEEVKAQRDAYRDAQDRGALVEKDWTFSEWADVWFEQHKDNIKPTTQENYVYTLRILKSNIGRRRVADVKAMDIEVLLRKLRREGRSDSCLAQCRGMLYQIFNKAEANDLVNKNPVRFAEKMRKRPPKRKEAYTAEEVKLLLKNLPENKIGWSIRLLLCTGMRTQELLGLEPRHIAEDGSTILIEQAVVMEKGTAMIGTPKSFDSYRCVPVPPQFRYCARLLRDTDKKFVWEMDKRLDYPCNPSTFRTKYKQAIESVPGVRYLSPHSCRHTYVSQMQALGVDLATIQSLVGHADVDMTKHYLHVQDPIRLAAITKFDRAFSDEPETHPNIIDFMKSS
jgi:integrase